MFLFTELLHVPVFSRITLPVSSMMALYFGNLSHVTRGEIKLGVEEERSDGGLPAALSGC